VTGVASSVLLANVSDQRLRMLHLHLQSGDQGVFSVNDNVTRFTLEFKANRKLHRCSPVFNENSTIQLDGEVCLSFSIGVASARDVYHSLDVQITRNWTAVGAELIE
jgi:hypothetical protein